MRDSGHEAVGHALLVAGVSIGALGTAELAGLVMRSLDHLITALA